MRIDVITIFPEYLEPMRHALLGKAIEDQRLVVGIHDLRAWATGAHRSVDDTPAGGGPGMVMQPEVWGQALDAVAVGTSDGHRLDTAAAHTGGPRHDELVGAADFRYGDGDGEADDRPLLLVPTPAGAPFTQRDAQEWSREAHIVFACGRYEGIDQRVFIDARQRYRVREVSIGDYVLIGGEVAVLAITEAVVRLIPGVLGNQQSHREDSFSDGLLEGYSYTRPRTWRGLSVPDVLYSGDHARIARFRHEESLRRTYQVRPELIDRTALSMADELVLFGRDVTTQLQVLMSEARWHKSARRLAKKLRAKGYEVAEVHGEVMDLGCEPDNVLVAEYEQQHGTPPVDPVLRVIVNGRSARPTVQLTRAVVEALPSGTPWYGSSYEGHTEPGITTACAWRPADS